MMGYKIIEYREKVGLTFSNGRQNDYDLRAPFAMNNEFKIVSLLALLSVVSPLQGKGSQL